ncbi:hypothetical protein HD806DRAFT_499351 [Xylariaceae sp. AK1471]|nr:hypothetical protein HD806DRAFT_499351 [Xylariaceae sp. AK1471]
MLDMTAITYSATWILTGATSDRAVKEESGLEIPKLIRLNRQRKRPCKKILPNSAVSSGNRPIYAMLACCRISHREQAQRHGLDIYLKTTWQMFVLERAIKAPNFTLFNTIARA